MASTCSARRTRNLALALVTLAALAGAFLLTLAYPASSAQDAPDLWVAAAMRTPRNSHSLTELLDGRVLAAGGWDGTAPLASAEIFEPERQAWTPTGALSETRAYHTAARLPDGRVLVAGGWDLSGRPLTTTELYDPGTAVWRPGAALAEGRAGHVAVTLADGRILVAAGCGPKAETLATAEVYDAKAAVWQEAGALAEGRCWPTATVLADGRVLLVGGRGGEGRPVGSAELYDPAKDAWTPAGKLLTPRLEHTATLLPDGRVLVTGGYDGSGYLASAEVYDPATNTWQAAGELTAARANHAAVLLRDGRVLVAGGSAGSRPTLETEIYDPQTGRWMPAGPLPARYEAFLLAALRDGGLLVTGRPDLDEAPIRLTTPEPVRTPGPRGPTPTPQDAPALNAAARNLAAGNVNGAALAMAQAATASTSNYTTGTQTARLFGVHEVSFTRPQPTPTGYNPYAETITVTFDLPGVGASGNLTVRAFYDGATDDQETWRARVYVNRVGAWGWTASTGASESFETEEAYGSGLHGMLRVSSASDTTTSGRSQNGNVVEAWATRVGTPKRWYTDDGRTFLPMADTAYLLFFEKPIASTPSVPTTCPPQTAAEAPAFVATYTSEDTSRGINVLRAMALGTWAYPETSTEQCTADLSLYWSGTTDGSSSDLFDGQPSLATLQAPTAPLYPNLESFQRTDRKLRQLLDEQPELYVQVIFLPDSYTDNHPWKTIDPTLRHQMWETMAARWAAFPNVFWTITNDTADKFAELTPTPTLTGTLPAPTPGPTPTPTPTELYLVTLAKEIGCYFADNPDQTTCSNIPDYNPWRKNRPLSVGHLRNSRDAFAPTTPSAPPEATWHNYITAYTNADISAQQMDGTRTVPENGELLPLHYVDQVEPVLNTEDLFEGPYQPVGTPRPPLRKFVQDPNYFYRRLFWSYLLSGSGVTYGADPIWKGKATYTDGTYLVEDASCGGLGGNTCSLTGLDGVANIPDILAHARVDLNLFKPQDLRVTVSTPTPGAITWTDTTLEVNRAQVAVRDGEEMLIYNPNTKLDAYTDQTWPDWERRKATVAQWRPYLTVAMDGFPKGDYEVTWYSTSEEGVHTAPTVQPYSGSGPLTVRAPSIAPTYQPYAKDPILHISSRCAAPNACEPMDSAAPAHTMTSALGINFYAEEPSTLTLDQTQYVIGNAQSDHGSWRCDRNVAAGQENAAPGCVLTYVFPTAKPFASVDYYFRRTTGHAHQSISFITAGEGNITLGQWGYWAEGEIDIGINPEQDVFSQLSEESGNPYAFDEFDVLHDVPLDSDRWYHLKVTAETWKEDNPSPQIHHADLKAYVDGRLVYSKTGLKFNKGDVFFRGVQLHTAWWGPITDLQATDMPSVWLDEVSIDPPPDTELQGLYTTYFQAGLGGYADTSGTYFDGAAGYDGSNFLRVGANNSSKALLGFDVDTIPANAIIDEATLALFYTGRSNANSLTLGAHGVLAGWAANVANRTQRLTGANWNVPGMGAGSDYTATPAATLAVVGEGNAWVELDVTALAQTWVSNASQNHGLVLLQEAASGSVVYSFCSEVAQASATPTPPCVAGHAPKLTLRYHLVEPAPLKAAFQRGANSYTGNVATYFDGSGNGYNSSSYLRVSGDGSQKSLLRFDVSSIPIADTIDAATLRVYQMGQSIANSLTLASHRVLADWTDSQANRTQRQNGVNWQVAGMSAGSDYDATADGTVELTSADKGWIDVDVTAMAQAWVANPTDNHGLVLLPQAASGSVTYSFCSELGWSPCTQAQAPMLKVWHHQPTPEPTPEPEPEP